MKTNNLIPAAPLDRRELAPGVQLCFTRLDAPLCPPPLDWPRLLVFDFCRSGRRAIPDGAQYAIVTEGHAAVSFAVPGADFYLPGSQYEALQLFIDPDAVQADSYEELAEKLGIDAEGLKASVEQYNADAAAGTENAQVAAVPKRALDAEGPYYGVRVEAANHMTKGGVVCNENAQVLNADDTVVPGLYAAGEVTWQGGGYSESVCFGKVAGAQAAMAE